MIAQRQADGQARLLPHPRAAIHFDVRRLRKFPQVPLEPGRRTVLAADRNLCALSQQFRGHVENQFRLGRFAGHHRRRQQPLPLPSRQRRQRSLQFLQIVRGKSETAQNGLLGFRAGGVVMAPDIPKTGIDSECRSGAVQKLLECLGHEEG